MVRCYGRVSSLLQLELKAIALTLFLPRWTEHTSADVPDYVIGTYVTNNPAGVRTHPYSTNSTTNPLRYSSVASLSEVHNIGEVWANMLHNVYAALVQEYGFSQTAQTDPS